MNGQMTSIQNQTKSLEQNSPKGKTNEALAEAFSSSLANIASRASRSTGGSSEEGESANSGAVVTASNGTATSSSDNDRTASEERFATRSSSSDEIGLPVPRDDRLRARSEHATVIAHLPPPNADSSSGSGGEAEERLVQPHREPGFHTIRRTFKQFSHPKQALETDLSSGENNLHRKAKRVKREESRKRPYRNASKEKDGSGTDENGGSSGSGTEGGYAGSASSNDPAPGVGSCSSPSVSSSESSHAQRKHGMKHDINMSGDPNRPMLSKKQESSVSVSSELADFSSESASESYSLRVFRDSSPSPSESPSITSSSNNGASDQDDAASVEATKKPAARKSKTHVRWPPLALQVSPKPTRKRVHIDDAKPAAKGPKPPIMSVGCDVMAHILTFLEPPDILDVLTAPLSKDWLSSFTRQQELWRVLCLLDPFKARVEENDSDSSDDSMASSYPLSVETELRQTFGKFRLLYTSFVKCMRYLAQIKDDATSGRAPSMSEATSKVTSHDISSNQNLQLFLARARGVVAPRPAPSSDISDDDEGNAVARRVAQAEPIGLSDDGSSTASRKRKKSSSAESAKKKRKLKFGHSALTRRLLGPSAAGDPGDVNLPWSCAIYSIVNWMAAFSDVAGIQIMCLKVLPLILENEQHRITAQRAGLTSIVLRDMVMFPDNVQLHTASFHTIVLLARPLGGQEGMLFHSSMVNASGIFDQGQNGGKNGIAVMLDSMRRFSSDGVLQAMACWSLVNIALAPMQKRVLVSLGGIEATANAMMQHPFNAEVQFRGLFALINLVIPSVSLNAAEDGDNDDNNSTAEGEESEKEMLDEMVDQIVNLVVLAMKNFCSSEAILNRACLVLHNLSLTQSYHSALLWTPSCYQMLDWCLANYRTDQVLQQSAAGTLHRLQITLSSDETLRARFSSSLQAQQQLSLQEAHREAVYLRDQQEQVTRRRQEQN